MTPESSALTARVQSGSPYQLDQSQILRASTALLNHMEKSAAQVALASEKKDLLAHSNSSSPSPTGGEPIWLVLTTKHHITSQARLKPGKVSLPHSLNTNPSSSICIIVPDPQRTFKDIIAHPLFPIPLGKRITKVIGISKLKARYKSFESRRQLRDEHDVFLADKRVVTMLPKSLGKVFYSSGTKRPVPIDLEGYKPKKDEGANKFSVVKKKPEKDEGRTAAPPAQCAKEIERALGCALVHLSPAATTSVKVGLSSFTSQQISDNVEAVVNGMIEKFVTKGWRNVKAIHVKGPNTMALPIWLAEELWIDETDVLEPEKAEQAKLLAKQRGKKQKGTKLVKAGDAMDDTSKKRKLEDTGFPQEMKERREKLKAQKKEMREAEDQLIEREKVAKAGEPPVKKAKRRKIAAEE
ncbi:MAG: hypothetical protein Q9191_000191 [Dirinaria sp. TL-2023a]